MVSQVNTRSPFLNLLRLNVSEVVFTVGAIKHAKLQSNHHHQQTNTQLLTGQMPFLLPYALVSGHRMEVTMNMAR